MPYLGFKIHLVFSNQNATFVDQGFGIPNSSRESESIDMAGQLMNMIFNT